MKTTIALSLFAVLSTSSAFAHSKVVCADNYSNQSHYIQNELNSGIQSAEAEGFTKSNSMTSSNAGDRTVVCVLLERPAKAPKK